MSSQVLAILLLSFLLLVLLFFLSPFILQVGLLFFLLQVFFPYSYVSVSFSSQGTHLAALSSMGMSCRRPSLSKPCPQFFFYERDIVGWMMMMMVIKILIPLFLFMLSKKYIFLMFFFIFFNSLPIINLKHLLKKNAILPHIKILIISAFACKFSNIP